MFYICVEDSTEPGAWCFLDKRHTWDQACRVMSEIVSVQSKPCKVEWCRTQPSYAKTKCAYS